MCGTENEEAPKGVAEGDGEAGKLKENGFDGEKGFIFGLLGFLYNDDTNFHESRKLTSHV